MQKVPVLYALLFCWLMSINSGQAQFSIDLAIGQHFPILHDDFAAAVISPTPANSTNVVYIHDHTSYGKGQSWQLGIAYRYRQVVAGLAVSQFLGSRQYLDFGALSTSDEQSIRGRTWRLLPYVQIHTPLRQASPWSVYARIGALVAFNTKTDSQRLFDNNLDDELVLMETESVGPRAVGGQANAVKLRKD